MVGIGIDVGSDRFSWANYWNGLLSDMAFYSDTFDFTNNQWTDQSGNDNHVNVLTPYRVLNGAWGLEITNWLSAYGFSTYHEFIYDSSAYAIIFTLGSSTSADKYMRIQTDISNNLYLCTQVCPIN